MSFFVLSFWILCLVCILLYLYTRTALNVITKDVGFNTFQRSYLVVYLLATAGDWLQGPHIYVLYESYGMTGHQIELLFVVGFGSSLLFGTIIGSVADKFGRRVNCIMYGIFTCLSCVTKNYANFYILLCGRILGGISTSILFSAFESWLVHEFNKRKFDQSLLGNIFSISVLGNSIIAIVMGLVAQIAADKFGYVAPFDVAIIVLIPMILVIMYTWSENYGDQAIDFFSSLKSAFTSIKTDYKVLCLGLIQSLFEGSMYVFVLEWTPSLTSSGQPASPSTGSTKVELLPIPHGIIFAGFMLCIMIGSSIFKILSKYHPIESFMRFILLVSAVSLIIPVLFPLKQSVIFLAFVVFEICVGVFWPSLGTLRGKYLPDATRATIMNFFRVPLNIIVIVILISNVSKNVMFMCCTLFLFLATLSQQWLYSLYQELPKSQTSLKGEQVTI